MNLSWLIPVPILIRMSLVSAADGVIHLAVFCHKDEQ